ncbi:MAG: SH3 domain-containing protein [Patescibacteria group bacterium]
MKKIIAILVLVLGMMFGAKPVQAGFGVSPSNISHEYLKPGGHFEQTITLSRSDPDEDLEILVEPSLEEMRDWFSFNPGMKFTFPKGQNRMVLTAIVDVPTDVPYKTYQGIVRIKAMTAGGVPGGVAVVKGARVDVELVTTKIDVAQLEVRQMKMIDVVGKDNLKLEVELVNRGNTEISPTAKVKVMNLEMQTLEELEDLDIGVIKPNETKTMVAEFETKLGQGEYFAEASLLSSKSVVRKERLVFRISEREKIDQIVTKSDKLKEIVKMLGDRQFLAKMLLGLLVVAMVVAFVKAKEKRGLILKIIIGLLIALGLWMGITKLISMRQNKAIEQEEVVKVPNEDGLKVTAGDKSVEGAAIDRGSQSYPLHSEADSTSQIVYYAYEGEEMMVLEERADWYRVVLPDSTSGWLLKANVKGAKSSLK